MESTFSTTCGVGSVEGEKKKSRHEMKFGFPHSHTFFEIHVFFEKGIIGGLHPGIPGGVSEEAEGTTSSTGNMEVWWGSRSRCRGWL